MPDDVMLVTGAAGFIGSNLVARLLEDGHRVVAVDDLSTGRLENLVHVRGRLAAIHEGDVADAGLLARALAGIQYAYHLAAIPSVPRSIADPVASARA